MTDKSNSDEPDSSASGNRPKPNIRRPKPRPQGLAGIAKSATNVDNAKGPVTRRPAPNVDKSQPSTNVDNPQAARPQQHTNVDKNKDTGRSPNTNVDKKEEHEDTPQSFQFPGAKSNSKHDPSKPRGPSKSVLERIQASKRQLINDNRDLDQTKGASPSRPSPSVFANTKHTTVSKKTSAQYLNRGRLLINRYKRELSIPIDYDDFDAREFVLWLLSQKPNLKSSTWRVYRQAAYHTLQGKPDDDIEEALELLDNDIAGRDPEADVPAEAHEDDEAAPKRREYRTSAKKEKKFPKVELEKYLAYLQYRSRSKLAPVLTDYLIASIYCGLRPVEWRATAFETSRDPATGKLYAWLYVLNAKTTNARGNGLVRTLDLSDVPAPILNAIKRTSERGLSWFEEGKYEEMQSQLSQLVYQIGDHLFPRRKKHFSLYSCRHQFIANMKTLMTPEEVSALAGHVVTKTAQASYGKKRSAWAPGDLKYYAKPIKEEVDTVRKTADFYKDRIEKLKMAGLIHGNSDESWPT